MGIDKILMSIHELHSFSDWIEYIVTLIGIGQFILVLLEKVAPKINHAKNQSNTCDRHFNTLFQPWFVVVSFLRCRRRKR